MKKQIKIIFQGELPNIIWSNIPRFEFLLLYSFHITLQKANYI